MHDDLLNGLRWVLMSADEGWRSELHMVLDRTNADETLLAEARDMLSARVDDAAPAFRDRMRAMVEEIGKRMGPQRGDDTPVGKLARDYVDLDEQIATLRTQIARLEEQKSGLAERISELLGPEGSTEERGYRFVNRPPTRDVTVVDPWALPSELTEPAPDMERVRAAWELERRAPPGAKVVPVPARLDVERVLL